MAYGVQDVVVRKDVGEVVIDAIKIERDRGLTYQLATVEVGAASEADVQPMGLPVVWNNTAGYFEVFIDQDISAVTGSPLDDESPCAIVVGDNRGFGFNNEDMTIGTTPVKMTAIYNGIGGVTVNYEGVDFGTALAADVAAFKVQMAKQLVKAGKAAQAATVSLI